MIPKGVCWALALWCALGFALGCAQQGAASAAAQRVTSSGTEPLSGFRITTWLPGVPPATCNHRSCGSATLNVRWSLSLAALPTKISKPAWLKLR